MNPPPSSPRLNLAFCMHTGMGGSGIMATELALSLAKKGHQVHIIGSSLPVRLQEPYPDVMFHQVPVTDYPVFEHAPYEEDLAGTIVEVCRQYHIDLLHVHYAIPHAMAGILAKDILAKKQSLPVVVTLHGTDVSMLGSRIHLNPVIKYALKRADAITAVSKDLKKISLSTFGLKRDDIQVIYNFARERTHNPEITEHLKAKLNPEAKPLLIHISNFRPVKRIENTLKIFTRVLRQIDCKLILVGDGPERPRIESLVQEKNLINQVEFVGYQNCPENYLKTSQVFLLQSEKESFGLSALEAMKQGLPVVSSNRGGLPELVGDPANLFPPGSIKRSSERVIELLSNPEEYEQASTFALQQAQKFNLEHIEQQYLELYYSCL